MLRVSTLELNTQGQVHRDAPRAGHGAPAHHRHLRGNHRQGRPAGLPRACERSPALLRPASSCLDFYEIIRRNHLLGLVKMSVFCRCTASHTIFNLSTTIAALRPSSLPLVNQYNSIDVSQNQTRIVTILSGSL